MLHARLRLTAIAAAMVVAAVLTPFALAASPPSLPTLFARQIRAIHRAAKAPAVLLPRSMPLDATRLFASGGPGGGPGGGGYDLEVGAARNCGGATACFVAAFTAARGTKVYGRRVTVKGASRAGFVPLSCGASCAPPQIDFVWHGVRYTIQANLNTRQGDRAALVAAAQSAISAGPR
ncbi:MAG: hypothetical protein ACXVRP_08045 [Solirubrobacteraceae bacterium]